MNYVYFKVHPKKMVKTIMVIIKKYAFYLPRPYVTSLLWVCGFVAAWLRAASHFYKVRLLGFILWIWRMRAICECVLLRICAICECVFFWRMCAISEYVFFWRCVLFVNVCSFADVCYLWMCVLLRICAVCWCVFFCRYVLFVHVCSLADVYYI